MIIKVCGLKEDQNILDVTSLDIQWIGYNFYSRSKRYLNNVPQCNNLINQKKVGVFVNQNLDEINEKYRLFSLDFIQLHGDEDATYCAQARQIGPIIKVFRIHDLFDFDVLQEYNIADFFLFDNATNHFGGSGKKFNWDLLKMTKISRPFLLSGGIGLDDYTHLSHFNEDQFMGIDINSKFEISPGIKNVSMIQEFIQLLHHHKEIKQI